jgi:hypothetical protein
VLRVNLDQRGIPDRCSASAPRPITIGARTSDMAIAMFALSERPARKGCERPSSQSGPTRREILFEMQVLDLVTMPAKRETPSPKRSADTPDVGDQAEGLRLIHTPGRAVYGEPTIASARR